MMYCSGCGAAATTGVAFCPRCGTKLVTTQALTGTTGPDKLGDVLKTLASVTAVFGVLGIGATAWAVVALIRMGLEPPAAITLAFFMLVTVGGGLFLLLRQMSKVLDAYLHSGSGSETNAVAPPQLKPAQAPQLEAAHTPFVSVVEHTTRTLDAVPRETR